MVVVQKKYVAFNDKKSRLWRDFLLAQLGESLTIKPKGKAMTEQKKSKKDVKLDKGYSIVTPLERKYVFDVADGQKRVSEIAKPKKEILTDSKMRQLFGENYHGLIFYNYDFGLWNAEKFHGYKIETNEIDLKQLKKNMEKEPGFSGDELVAIVIMLIQKDKFPGAGKVIKNPQMNFNGWAVVGNLVKRDKKTGNILPVHDAWLGAHVSGSLCGACRYGAAWFANDVTKKADFRHSLIRAHTR